MTPAKPAELPVTPRDIRFEPRKGYQRHWLGGDPVGTAVMNALSLTFPDGERLFVDAVRHYRERLSPALQDETRRFIAQEALHSREHQSLNDLIDPEIYPVAEILEKIRARIAMARARGPFGMLVSTIALEHFTAMMAEVHMAAGDRLFAGRSHVSNGCGAGTPLRKPSTRPSPTMSSWKSRVTGIRCAGTGCGYGPWR